LQGGGGEEFVDFEFILRGQLGMSWAEKLEEGFVRLASTELI